MDYVTLKAALSDPSAVREAPFAILREIARHVNQRATHNEGRDLVIRALAVKDSFGQTEQEVLFSLVRSVGLFPYMTNNLALSDIGDHLAYELHRADYIEDDLVFHSLQAKIYHQLMSGANVVLSASTSVGKSLVVDALVASEKYRKVVVVVPTVALIDETRRRLLLRFKDRCSVITHPTQVAHPERINIYVLTQERVLHRGDLDDIDLFIIDEFYKVNIGVDAEPDRAVDLNLAFHKLVRNGAQFYLLGPNIHALRGLGAYEYHFIPSEFTTVAVDVVNLNLPTKGDDRDIKLLELCNTLDGPTIVYCQSPRSASDVARLLASDGNLPVLDSTASAADWIADQYHPDWSVCQALRRGIGIHHGGVPRALQQYFIRLFNDRKIPLLVCTSTIIEGVNTVAKNVIVYDRRKSRDVLEHFTYKNIEGRAGRMREYFIGRVFVLEAAPADKSYSVVFPIGQQEPDTPLSLLLDLEDEYLAPVSRSRLDQLFSESTLSPETLRLNRHTPVDAQESIASEIRSDLRKHHRELAWRGIPNAAELQFLCNIVFQHLESKLLPSYGIFSGDSLAWHLNALRVLHNLSAYVDQCVERRRDDWTPSDAVEMALRFVRNVVCQRLPRDIMVIDAIQRDVFSQSGRAAGDYSAFAEQAENLFMPSSLFALDEYGVPVQTAQRLAPFLLPAETLDEILARLYMLDLTDLGLAEFELELLEEVRRTIYPAL